MGDDCGQRPNVSRGNDLGTRAIIDLNPSIETRYDAINSFLFPLLPLVPLHRSGAYNESIVRSIFDFSLLDSTSTTPDYLKPTLAQQSAGTPANDLLVANGGAGSFTLAGGLGNDVLVVTSGSGTLTGGPGKDIYAIRSLSNEIVISAQSASGDNQDRLYFGPSILPASFLVPTVSGADLILNASNGHHITIQNWYGDPNYQLPEIGFLLNDPSNISTPTGYVDLIRYSNDPNAANSLAAIGIPQFLIGGSQNDTIYGADAPTVADALFGYAGIDTLFARAGNDTLDGGAGADTMVGGPGNDTYIVDNIGDTITELASGGTDNVQSLVTHTLPGQFENLTLTGSSAINGTGNSLNNIIIGNAGSNVLNGLTGIDTLSYVNADAGVTVTLASTVAQNTAGAGIDTLSGFENLTGSNFGDSLSGNSGANILTGGSGADVMAGGAGNDTYIVDNAADAVSELVGGGLDIVQSSVTYTLANEVENLTLTGTSPISGTGNALNNVLTGNTGNNTLIGLGGNDRLNGGAGADIMIGGFGDDIYVVGVSTDVVTELVGEGTDTVESSITYILGTTILGPTLENLTLTGAIAINGTGNSANNVINGNSAVNTLTGNDGNDTLNGNGGNDVLSGGIGNDRLTGSTGNDSLTGGMGLDLFVFNTALNATTNVDTIGDFTLGQDTIIFGKTVFTTLMGSNVPLDPTEFFFGAGSTTGADANDHIVYNSTNGNLYYDADGSGAGAFMLFAMLAAPVGLTAASFFVEL